MLTRVNPDVVRRPVCCYSFFTLCRPWLFSLRLKDDAQGVGKRISRMYGWLGVGGGGVKASVSTGVCEGACSVMCLSSLSVRVLSVRLMMCWGSLFQSRVVRGMKGWRVGAGVVCRELTAV